jgi:hypothetical protein
MHLRRNMIEAGQPFTVVLTYSKGESLTALIPMSCCIAFAVLDVLGHAQPLW